MIISAIAAAAAATIGTCSWDNPGVNPFNGDIVEAIRSYSDIPSSDREEIVRKVQTKSYDDFALIRSGSIVGNRSEYTDLRDMHFGNGSKCTTVTRNWKEDMRERGLVFCSSGHCVIIPTVCRNVSRVTPVVRHEEKIEFSLMVDDIPVDTLGLPSFVVSKPLDITTITVTTFSKSGFTFSGEGKLTVTTPSIDTDRYLRPSYTITGSVPSVVVPVPEPHEWALMSFGLLFMGLWVKLSRKNRG